MQHGKGETQTVDRTMLAVERALGELRRGRAVRIEGDGRALLALPVEAATGDALGALVRQAGHPPRLVLTRERAAFLGLEGQSAAVALDPPAGESLEWARRLAWAVPGGQGAGGIGAMATLLEVRGLELLKHGRMLPALLAAPLDPEIAREEAWTDQILGVEAEAIAAYPAALLRSLSKIGEARVPLADAEDSRFVLFRGGDGISEHVAILVGRPDPDRPVLVRLHSACLTGDLFGSLRCDCGEQLRSTIAAMAKAGGGVLLYLAQEGRNIGLANKLRAYA
ncbi:MAG: GTP cyclohydrolase II, partial [Candidatus Competibacteraceae bacterium]|nr:GTP cyclohydrolase II [Candidatus Competibacteraceae bacterium]